MTNDERKAIIRQLLAEGRTLSQVQDYLQREKGDTITYMELRLLLSEMPDVKLPEKEPPRAVSTTTAAAPVADKKAGSTSGAGTPAGQLSISVDQTPPPGALLSGYARFASGAKAHWFVDELGRLGIEPELGSSKPTQADMQEFTRELRRLLESPRNGFM
ncbi:MAG: hypothetical protein NZ483_07395 [Verrucomicrobiae bacterium]|nr:hypothetical protein [Verrucomicrobiae bacterium]MDW8344294.1 hypothetical protein [Verrucomicrobiae bacterium]